MKMAIYALMTLDFFFGQVLGTVALVYSTYEMHKASEFYDKYIPAESHSIEGNKTEIILVCKYSYITAFYSLTQHPIQRVFSYKKIKTNKKRNKQKIII